MPASAVVVDQGAVATTFIVAYAVFAAIFFVLVLGLVALASKPPWRAGQVRSTLLWYPAGALAALVVLGGCARRTTTRASRPSCSAASPSCSSAAAR